MPTDLSRYDDWLAWLGATGESDPDVRCIWVGGSAATGGYDEWSDLDLDVLCTPGTVHDVYDRLLADPRRLRRRPRLGAAAGDLAGRAAVLRQPRPGPRRADRADADRRPAPLGPVRGAPARRRTPPRHPIVVHDPEGLVVLRHGDEEALQRAIAEAIDQIAQRHATSEWLVNRAIRRGQAAEATQFYLAFAFTPLVRLLRAKHCPWRHDFGPRYLHTDLPADVADRLTALLPGAGDPAALSTACFTWTRELLRERAG